MERSPYQILPDLLPEEYESLKASVAEHGVQVPIIVDQDGHTIDGFHRLRACDELGIECPREVRHFESETDNFELALRLNCHRRMLNREQKRDLIAVYLRRDPQIADNTLADLIGGVSKNTVADVREELVGTCQIDKFEKLRGKDGKDRPVKYKKIVANTAKEAETALKVINDLPDNCEGKTLDVITAKRRAWRNRKLMERAQQPIPLITPDDINLYHCPFQELEAVADISPGSVKLILTDIPYGGSFLSQVSELADLASRLLAEGGLLVTYCGHLFLPEIFRRLGEHLTYAWMCASVWDGDGNLIRPRDVVSQWKPIVVYSKGEWVTRRRWPDMSRVNSKEKDWHPWQQPLEEVEGMVRYFSKPGDLVLDPCGGGFTTAVACHRTDRRFIGCDCEESCVVRGRQRLAEETLRRHPAQGGQEVSLLTASGSMDIVSPASYTIHFSLLGSVIWDGQDEEDVRGQILRDWQDQLDDGHFDSLESMTVVRTESSTTPEREVRRRRKFDLDAPESPVRFMIYFRACGTVTLEGRTEEEVRELFGEDWDCHLQFPDDIERLEVLRVEPYEEEAIDTETIPAIPSQSPEKLLEDLRIWIEDAADAQFSQSAVLDTWDQFSGLHRSEFPHYLALLAEPYQTMWLSLAV